MKKTDLTYQELKFLLKNEGITVRPKYHHDDYMYTSFTMPYPLKNKLDRVAKKNGITRSRVIQMLLQSIDENNFIKSLNQYK